MIRFSFPSKILIVSPSMSCKNCSCDVEAFAESLVRAFITIVHSEINFWWAFFSDKANRRVWAFTDVSTKIVLKWVIGLPNFWMTINDLA